MQRRRQLWGGSKPAKPSLPQLICSTFVALSNPAMLERDYYGVAEPGDSIHFVAITWQQQ